MFKTLALFLAALSSANAALSYSSVTCPSHNWKVQKHELATLFRPAYDISHSIPSNVIARYVSLSSSCKQNAIVMTRLGGSEGPVQHHYEVEVVGWWVNYDIAIPDDGKMIDFVEVHYDKCKAEATMFTCALCCPRGYQAKHVSFEALPSGQEVTSLMAGDIAVSAKGRKNKVNIYPSHQHGGKDPDLEQSGLGNLLIIQSQDDPLSTPNDSAAGGVLRLDFQCRFQIRYLTLADVEEQGHVVTRDNAGVEKFRAGFGGVSDGETQTVLMDTNVDAHKLRFEFGGSGGVFNFGICVTADD